MPITMTAHAILIRRYCDRHGWDTYQDAADGTGLKYNQVNATVQRMKWAGRFTGRDQSAAGRRGINLRNKRRGSNFDEYALDLVDIFQ